MLSRKATISYEPNTSIGCHVILYERSIWIWVYLPTDEGSSEFQLGKFVSSDTMDLATVLTQRYNRPVVLNNSIDRGLLTDDFNIWMLTRLIELIEGSDQIHYEEGHHFDNELNKLSSK